MFKAQYVNLRNQFNETFENKIFAENIVFKCKRLKLTDESTYEQVHSNLHALELTEEEYGELQKYSKDFSGCNISDKS